MPADHVQRAVAKGRGPQQAAVFLHALGRAIHVLEPGDGGLEVARIGQTVGADGTEVRQAERAAVILADIAAHRTVDFHAEAHAARDDHDMAGRRLDHAHLGDKAVAPRLRHDQKLAVGGIEDAVGHRAVGDIEMDADTCAGISVAIAAIGGQTLDPVGRRLGHGQRVPAHAVGIGRGLGEGAGAHAALRERLIRPVLGRGPQTIEPAAQVVVARGGEGRARQLLGIEAQGRALRRVAADRQGALDGLGGEMIGEAGLIGGRVGSRHVVSPLRKV
ncbi:hypothetical protein D3C72_1238770 [compost metagenome]